MTPTSELHSFVSPLENKSALVGEFGAVTLYSFSRRSTERFQPKERLENKLKNDSSETQFLDEGGAAISNRVV